jgi:hypothetical protein
MSQTEPDQPYLAASMSGSRLSCGTTPATLIGEMSGADERGSAMEIYLETPRLLLRW